ncbi:tropomyosin [Parasitella parasitica]|nr:tropomyosin [Parasitella parasitica]
MDKIREKIATIRIEADTANAKVEELENELKNIKQEHTQQEREIISLNNKNKQLEEDLDTAHDTIKSLRDNETEDSDHKKHHENSLRKITLLEEELEESDKALKETTKK